MRAMPWWVAILSTEREAAEQYAGLSKEHTFRKLEQQRSRYSEPRRHSNIKLGRLARDVLARLFREHGIRCECDDSPHTEAAKYCIATHRGWLVQTRFIRNRPTYRNLLDDVPSFERRPHDFYVAMTSRDDLETMEILGYASREEMMERQPRDFGQGMRNYYVPLNRCHPLEELITTLLSKPERRGRRFPELSAGRNA